MFQKLYNGELHIDEDELSRKSPKHSKVITTKELIYTNKWWELLNKIGDNLSSIKTCGHLSSISLQIRYILIKLLSTLNINSFDRAGK